MVLCLQGVSILQMVVIHLKQKISDAFVQDQVDIPRLCVLAFVCGVGIGDVPYFSAAGMLGAIGMLGVYLMLKKAQLWAILTLSFGLGMLHIHWHKHYRYAWTVVDSAHSVRGSLHVESRHNYGERCRLVGHIQGLKVQAWVRAKDCENLGGVMHVRGRIYPLKKATNAGFSLNEYLRWQGIQGQLHTNHVYWAQRGPPRAQDLLLERARNLGSRSEVVRGLYSKLLLAQGNLQPQVRSDFSEAGIAHVLAISGLHINMLSSFVLASLLGSLLVWGYPMLASFFMRITLVVSLLVIWTYASLCWGSLTALRAILTSTALALMYLCRSKLCPLWASLSGGIGVLLCWPESLFRLGFQMSMLCVITIAGMIKRRAGFPKREAVPFQEFSLKTLASLGMSVRLSALTVVYATQIPGGGVLGLGLVANLIVIPFMALVVMPLLFIDAGLTVACVPTVWLWDVTITWTLCTLAALAQIFTYLNYVLSINLTGVSWVSYFAVAFGVCWCAFIRGRNYLWGRAGFLVPVAELVLHVSRKSLNLL